VTVMADPLQTALRIAASGLQAQSMRLRIVSENIANAQSTGPTPGASPYARQTVSFESEMDRTLGANLVEVKSIGVDSTPFKLERDPGNPAADENGMVKMPNVDVLVELADMREANRSYEANLQVAKQSADMLNTAVSLMKDA
jgi:flagellar basal-body rod protein FlgC